MKSAEYRRPRTDFHRKKRRTPGRERGSVEWVTGLCFVLFLTVLLCAQMQLSAFRTTALYLEDALAASNLASAVVDIEEYGISHTVRIDDVDEAYARYRNAVRENLGLDRNWEASNETLISGKVTVENYIVYNVEKDGVFIYQVSGDGQIHAGQGVPGKVTAPNGVPVERTGIYSELSFPVKGLFGVTVQARRGKLVDIVADPAAEDGAI